MENKENSRGVLLIAVGHPFYGNMAEQLCMSIKVVSHETKIVCAVAEGGINHLNGNHFDEIINIPKDFIYTNGLKDYLKAKVYLNELTPFDETIYIDADVIWCPKKPIDDLFDKFKDIDFTCANHSKTDIKQATKGFIHWADPKDIIEKCGITHGTLYNLASEFIYFKKTLQVDNLFGLAQDFYENPCIDFMRFGHSIPDELAFEVAMMLTGIYPHESPFLPFYWYHFEKTAGKGEWQPFQIYDAYYGYSIGGNVVEKKQQDIYNALANNACKKFGGKGYFPAKNKNSYLPERSVI